MTGHDLRPVESNSGDPMETVIVAAPVCLHCACGLMVCGRDADDLWRHYGEHVAAAHDCDEEAR